MAGRPERPTGREDGQPSGLDHTPEQAGDLRSRNPDRSYILCTGGQDTAAGPSRSPASYGPAAKTRAAELGPRLGLTQAP